MNSLRVWAQRLMLARALLLSFVTFVLLMLKFFEIELFTPEIDSTIFKLGLFLYLLNILYIYPVHRLSHHLLIFIYLQLFIDVILSASLINYTYRLESPFIFLFSLYIVSGALMIGRDGAWFCAILGIASICVLTVFDLLSLSFDRIQNTAVLIKEIVVRGLLHSVSLSVLSILMSFLSEQLKSTSSTLAQSEKDLASKQKDLQTLQGLYEKLIEEMKMGLILSDQNLQVLMMNPYAQQKLGLTLALDSKKELTSKTPIISLSEDLQLPLKKEDFDHLPSEYAIVWQYEQQATGQILKLDGHLSKINVLSEGNQGWLFLFQDVTQKKVLEEKMLKNQHLASIGQLASQIAHEIRNPLTAMSSGIELIKSGQVSQDKHQRIFDILESETKRLNHLISDFLKFAKPQDLHWAWVNLEDCLKEISELWSTHIKIKVIIKEQEQHTNILFQTDQNAFKQVFNNLIKNSIEANANEIEIEVILNLKNNHQSIDSLASLLLIIRDNGAGIDDFDNLQKQIFEPFFTNKEKGTGLGLAICLKIIHLHQGDLTLTSGHGPLGGCEFMIELPIKQSQDALNTQNLNAQNPNPNHSPLVM
jgi:two-component system sensor histidine kinase PilS (NtrC family)